MEPTTELRDDTKRAWAQLQTLRDEVRLKLHLAGMDARDEWDRIEALMPEVQKNMEKTAGDFEKVTREGVRTSLEEIIKRLERLRSALKR